MRTLARWEPFRGATSLQDHVNRLFNDDFERRGEESSLTAWAPAVDIYETEHELVVKADLPEIDPKDLDIRVENNILTIRGERKFEKKVNEDHYLRVQSAQEVAARHENQQIEPVHLLAALVTQADALCRHFWRGWACPTKRCPKRLSARSDACQKCKVLPSNTWGVR